MYSKGLIKNQELGKPFPTSLQSLYAYRISVFSKASELARYPVMWDMSTGNLKMNALFLPPNLLLLFYSVSELQVGLPTSLLIKFVIPFGNLKQVRPRFSTWKSLVSLHFPNKTKRRPSSSLPTALSVTENDLCLPEFTPSYLPTQFFSLGILFPALSQVS